MANHNPTTNHLAETQWQKGQSGNPRGRPKGSLNMASYIETLLTSDDFDYCRFTQAKTNLGTPIEAILKALIVKAIDGDIRAIDIVMKYATASTANQSAISFSNFSLEKYRK